MPAKRQSPPAKKRRATATSSARPRAIAARCIVGIGASAGGFEPIRALVGAMPADSGLAFVVIQHQTPGHKSLAAALLSKHTEMPVSLAEDGQRLKANSVYTAPADQFLSIDHGVLRFAPARTLHGLRLPIDHFFSALGADQHEKAIGIILSGTGADGAAGARVISAQGGIVLAQSPETAQFSGMPRSAVATGAVTQVLPVEQMPAAVLAYANHPYAVDAAQAEAASKTQAQELAGVLSLIRARDGFDFTGYKQGTLLRRILRRMGLLNLQRLADYVGLLRRNPAELDALQRDLHIGVTEFFRDPPAWQELQRNVVAPLLAANHGDRPIRAWVPGCATGEEAYTLAMLLLQARDQAKMNGPITVFATDVNAEAVHFGRNGIYPIAATARIPPSLLKHYFTESDTVGHLQVASQLRETVTFSRQNLIADPPFSRLDIISCRNLLIYLEPQVQDKVIALFHFALRPEGYLFLGSAETVGKRGQLFRVFSKRWRIYQAEKGTVREAPALPQPSISRPATAAGAATLQAKRAAVPVTTVAQQMILDRFVPAAVLVSREYAALYFWGPIENYLARPRGKPTLNLLPQLREGLRSQVRSAVRQALSTHGEVVIDDARVRRRQGYVPVKITVMPATADCDGMLLIFEDQPVPRKAAEEMPENANVRALEQELGATKEELQGALKAIEADAQEMTSTHEELLSGNEELQSANEELESSKEELQSLNEELNTVNQQLQNKVAELEQSKLDLQELINSSEIASLYLDQKLRIRWSTPAMASLFHLLPADAGRAVTDLGSPINDGTLEAQARAVMRKGTPDEHELSAADGHYYLRRIIPYLRRKQADGVVITYTDITASRQRGLAAAQQQQRDNQMLERQVRERTEQLREMAFALTDVEERERRQLAQDLHDDLMQLISVAQIKLRSRPPDPEIRDIDELLEKANRSMHSLAFQLSPAVLYELGLVPAIEWLADEMHRLYGLQVIVHGSGLRPPLEERVRTTLFRAVRELLINVAKHARVNVAVVKIDIGNSNNGTDRRALLIEVNDGGVGFDTTNITGRLGKGGFGLVSVRERLEMIGGTVTISSVPGDGTLVKLTVPLSPPVKAAGKKAKDGP